MLPLQWLTSCGGRVRIPAKEENINSKLIVKCNKIVLRGRRDLLIFNSIIQCMMRACAIYHACNIGFRVALV